MLTIWADAGVSRRHRLAAQLPKLSLAYTSTNVLASINVVLYDLVFHLISFHIKHSWGVIFRPETLLLRFLINACML